MVSRLLVLGANGFIGSHLVDSLASLGHNVRAFVRNDHGEIKFNLSENVEVFQGDFFNLRNLVSALEGIDYVFHFISTSTPLNSDDDPLIDIDTNVRMSVKLFKACANAGVKRVIFASSGGAIYGTNTQMSLQKNKRISHKESDALYPISPYAIGKLSIERYLQYYKLKTGISSLVLRISNPYGERQPFHRKQGVIPIFLESICRGEPIIVMGDGSATRDYIYIKDLTNIIAKIFDRELKYDTYNIGSGNSISINEIVRMAENISGKKAEIQYVEMPTTYIKDVNLNTTLLKKELVDVDITKLHTGMTKTYRYIKECINNGR